MKKHTEGPWTVYSQRTGVSGPELGHMITTIHNAKGPVVAFAQHVGGKSYPELSANSDLIAAAPELLEALQGFESLVDIWLPANVAEEHRGEAEALHALRNKALAAIAKATGK